MWNLFLKICYYYCMRVWRGECTCATAGTWKLGKLGNSGKHRKVVLLIHPNMLTGYIKLNFLPLLIQISPFQRETLAADGCWKREILSFASVFSLVGFPSSSMWLHAMHIRQALIGWSGLPEKKKTRSWEWDTLRKLEEGNGKVDTIVRHCINIYEVQE